MFSINVITTFLWPFIKLIWKISLSPLSPPTAQSRNEKINAKYPPKRSTSQLPTMQSSNQKTIKNLKNQSIKKRTISNHFEAEKIINKKCKRWLKPIKIRVAIKTVSGETFRLLSGMINGILSVARQYCDSLSLYLIKTLFYTQWFWKEKTVPRCIPSHSLQLQIIKKKKKRNVSLTLIRIQRKANITHFFLPLWNVITIDWFSISLQ